MSVLSSLTPPKPCWAWKPKSKLTDESSDNAGGGGGGSSGGGGLFGKAFATMRNNINATSWNRRYISIQGGQVRYGAKPNQLEKSIPLEMIKGAQSCGVEVMRALRAPDQFVEFGWKLVVQGKDISFCCEDEASRTEWVSYLEQLIQALNSGSSGGGGGGGGGASGRNADDAVSMRGSEYRQNIDRTGDANGDDGEDESGVATTTAALMARAQQQKMINRERAKSHFPGAPPVDDTASLSGAPGNYDDDDAVSMAPNQDNANVKSQVELRSLIADDDDDIDFDKLLDEGNDQEGNADDLDDDSDEEDDDEDEEEDDEEERTSSSPREDRSERRKKAPRVSRDEQYRRFLMPLAKQVYSHIQYKLGPTHEKYLIKGDSLRNVLFSRTVEKIGKRENNEKRDLVVTTQCMYLFPHQPRTFGFWLPNEVRALQLEQLVGVIESTIESNLVALLFPSFHDVLIRIIPQSSLIIATEVQVKHQLIATLYAAVRKLNTGREFIFREAQNVRERIRRSEFDEHKPLASHPQGDKLRCASQAALYAKLRVNAETTVLWSSIVRRFNPDRSQSRKAFVIADLAFYFVSDDLRHAQRRTALSEISKILYDIDVQAILVKCVEVDALFTVEDSNEFVQLRTALSDAYTAATGLSAKCSSSKSLFAHAQLIEKAKLREKFGDNTEGLKKFTLGLKKLTKQSWKVSLKSVDFVTNSVAKVGDKGLDFLKHASKEVGGALVDNQLTGQMLGVLGATGITNQSRIVHETLIDYNDEEELLANAEPFVDSLNIGSSPQAAEHKLGAVGFSSRCGLYNLVATIDHHKTENRLVVISKVGMTLFHPPDASFSLFSPLRGIMAQLSHGLKIDTQVEWDQVVGIVRSSQGDNVVGIQTTRGHMDVMLRLPNASLMAKFVSVGALMYMRNNPESRKFRRCVVDVHSAPGMEHIRVALKKILVDDKASVALRTTSTTVEKPEPVSSDPELATTIRRYGDNTVFFTGRAWRLRQSSAKKGSSEQVGQLLKDEDAQGDNKLFKSFILVVTNCAIYDIPKSGNNLHRRTELRDITQIMTSKADPNAILLVVPSEFDIYFRIEGRGQEFVERLQEAFATWTMYGFRLVHQLHTAQSPADFFVPITCADDLAAVGQLKKPARFNEEQANKSASDVCKQYQQWHKNQLVLAVAKYKSATEAASNGMIFEPENIPGYDASAAVGVRFVDVFTGLENAVLFVQFVHSRAYRFGLRAWTSPEMAVVQRVLLEWMDVTAVAEDLQRAMDEEDISRYEERYADLNEFPAFALLLKEQSGMFDVLRNKKDALLRITTMLEDKGRLLATREEELADAFDVAAKANVRPQTLLNLKQQADLRVQQERLTLKLNALSDDGMASLRQTTRNLLREAATKLQLEKGIIDSVTVIRAGKQHRGDDNKQPFDAPRLHSAMIAIDKAVQLGDSQLLADTLSRCKALRNEVCSVSDSACQHATVSELSDKIQFGAQQLSVLEHHEDVIRELDTLRASVKGKQQRSTELAEWVKELERWFAALNSIEQRLKSSDGGAQNPILDRVRALCAMHQAKIQEKLFVAKEEQRLGRREAQALLDAREAQRIREEAERQRFDEERKKEEQQAHERRLEFLNMWQVRCHKLAVSLKNAVAAHDASMVKQCVRNCVVFQQDVKQSYASMFASASHAPSSSPGDLHHQPSLSSMTTQPTISEEAAAMYAGTLSEITKRLTTASSVGQRYLDEVEPASSSSMSGHLARADASPYEGEAPPVIPEELPVLLQTGSSQQIAQFIQARQGTMSMSTINAIRALWSTAKAKREWVAKLHRSFHTAFSLNNAQLLQEHINTAKAAEFMDDHVAGAIEILKMMREAEAKALEAAGASASTPKSKNSNVEEDEVASPQIAAPLPVPPAMVKPLTMRWDQSPVGSAGHALYSLHRALSALAKMPSNSAGSQNPRKLRPVDDTMELRDVVQCWIQVLQHRAKPSGLFRKVERNVQDVLMFVGNVSQGGDVMAPYTNRLCSDFDRIKKFNNPNGHSSAYVILMYMLQRNDLTIVLSEFERVGQKALADVFYDDSLHRTNACLSELKLLVEMTEQFEWPFALQERSTVSTSVSIARTAEQSVTNSLNSVASPSSAASPNRKIARLAADGTDPDAPADLRRLDSARRSVTMLRMAVHSLSTFFAAQLKQLGSNPSAAHTQRLVEEGACKEVGILVREQLCPALMSILSSGLRSFHLLSKRRLWDVVMGLNERLKESTRGLGAVGIPDAIDMVCGITDLNGRNKTVLNRMDEDQLSDMRVRMLICHLLNLKLLYAFFESLFDDSENHAEFLKKYYSPERSMMIPLQKSEPAKEVMKVIRLLTQIPFALAIDAEVW